MSLRPAQVDALLAPLHPSRVRQVQGNAHLEAWDVRRHLLRVFGWGGWDFDVVSCDLVSERSKWDEQNPLKGRHTVVYRVVGRLTIRDPEGNRLASYEDGATGDAANQPSLGDAHDMALKTAMSQALKRCAMNLGDRFGLGLYNGGRTDAVVGGSLAHEHSDTPGASEHVEGGEIPTAEDLARDLTATEPGRVERQGRKKKSDTTPPAPDAWSTSDPTFLAEWRAALASADDTDVLDALAADLKAAIATGQVLGDDVEALKAEGKARREVLAAAPGPGQTDLLTGEVAAEPEGGWPAVAEVPA